MVSLFTGRPVKKGIAMTGEITLTGNVLPIGGLKEKVLAARRAKIKKVIIPHLNRKDLDEIPKSVRASMQIIPVEEVRQVLDIALSRNSSWTASSKKTSRS
jgi:ATP-dependent Lon protease